MNRVFALGLGILSAIVLFASTTPSEARVQIKNHQLNVDGRPQPHLFGAEVQYFRMRGGYGPNIPRERVIALWTKALDRAVEAKMNTVGFYIPWDFHEYAPGKFDFTGTVDQDGDGRPDYPSRDIQTFFKMLKERGITRIMARPGPYINAEWGFLGFGAVPEWFHDLYPDSHMRSPEGKRKALYDYHNPDLLRHTGIWFEALYRDVLKEQMKPGGPVVFLQLDNETNFQWQTIYNQDFGAPALARYRDYLKARYRGDLGAINRTHGRTWSDWSVIRPPLKRGENIAEDQDWYRFNDADIYSFLAKVRVIWETLGVSEPRILFTLAESYNAPADGLLPHNVYRNARGTTGLMTVNLYPKTYEPGHGVLMNSPFKADLDVKSADEANDGYLGSRQEWVLGPEIQGGWWKGTPVSDDSRQQTYLTVLGHGMKALYVYYFNEGHNWGAHFAYTKARPMFEALRREWRTGDIEPSRLPDTFWSELQERWERTHLVGFDIKNVMLSNPKDFETLYFDAPLDAQAEPRDHFLNLKLIGERVVAPHRDFLARARAVEDEVAIVKDSENHIPSPWRGLSAAHASSDWAAGLLGYMLNSDLNPSVLHGEISTAERFAGAKAIFHVDTGLNHPRTLQLLQLAFADGKGIVNFLASEVPRALGLKINETWLPVGDAIDSGLMGERQPVTFYIGSDGGLRVGSEPDAIAVPLRSTRPMFSYDLRLLPNCQGILFSQARIVGYRCKTTHGRFIQIGALVFDDYNSDSYADIKDARERRLLMKALTKELSVEPRLLLTEMQTEAAPLTAAFARRDPKRELLWITAKTGSRQPVEFRLSVTPKLLAQSLPISRRYRVTDLMTQKSWTIERDELATTGFAAALKGNGSTVYKVEASSVR